jgi:hypothetical protein
METEAYACDRKYTQIMLTGNSSANGLDVNRFTYRIPQTT